MKHAFLVVMAMLLGCQRNTVEEGGVKIAGSLKEMMHEGRTGPELALSTLKLDDLWGLGALSNLRGEVTILDGKALVTYPNGTSVRTTTGITDETAALFVYTTQKSWKTISLDRALSSTQLAQVVGAQLAPNPGPAPFVVDGTFERISWHVIDGSKLDQQAPHSHEQHQQTAVKGVATNVRARIFGFFSETHAGVFTHMGERTHMHVVMPAKEPFTAHVDDVVVAPGAALRIPK